MKREEHADLIHTIRANMSDEAKVTDLLTKLSDDYGAVTAELETAKKSAEELKATAESLREVNMRLFLKVGSAQPSQNELGQQTDEKKKFEDLFDEKGGLK